MKREMGNRMKLLTLDPSSTAIGYCISTGPGKLVEFGKITGPGKLNAIMRIEREMLPDLVKLVRNHMSDETDDQLIALIETPAPTQGASTKKRHPRGQATYGVAVGMVIGELRRLEVDRQYVRADQWANKVKKVFRQAFVEQKYPQYDAKKLKDTGMDVSDAIALSDWFWARHAIFK